MARMGHDVDRLRLNQPPARTVHSFARAAGTHQEISGPKGSAGSRRYLARLISRSATNGRHWLLR
jgi:hypothetical protein